MIAMKTGNGNFENLCTEKKPKIQNFLGLVTSWYYLFVPVCRLNVKFKEG